MQNNKLNQHITLNRNANFTVTESYVTRDFEQAIKIPSILIG